MSRPQALGNIRVVDFSWVRAGPWATRWLGAFGAEIIKSLVSLKFPEVFRLTSRFWGVVVLGSLPRSFSSHSAQYGSSPELTAGGRWIRTLGPRARLARCTRARARDARRYREAPKPIVRVGERFAARLERLSH